jgi:predicted flap endonuclease-1-like 5' DNA nuclease
MGRLTEGMTNLRDEIEALRNGRVEFIDGLKHGMSELKSDVADMQQGFRKDHTRMAGKLKDDLKAFTAGIGEYVSALKDDVIDMQENFSSDHADMSRKLKDDLNAFASGITSSVADLMDLFSNEHIEMTGKARAERKIFFSKLKQSLDTLKLKTADFLQDISDDLAGARRAWSGTTPAGQRVVGKVRRPANAQPKPDDLTQINGIGPVMSKRLNKAGIFTYAKLAQSTIEELQVALKESKRGANFEMWIKQAGKLSS